MKPNSWDEEGKAMSGDDGDEKKPQRFFAPASPLKLPGDCCDTSRTGSPAQGGRSLTFTSERTSERDIPGRGTRDTITNTMTIPSDLATDQNFIQAVAASMIKINVNPTFVDAVAKQVMLQVSDEVVERVVSNVSRRLGLNSRIALEYNSEEEDNGNHATHTSSSSFAIEGSQKRNSKLDRPIKRSNQESESGETWKKQLEQMIEQKVKDFFANQSSSSLPNDHNTSRSTEEEKGDSVHISLPQVYNHETQQPPATPTNERSSYWRWGIESMMSISKAILYAFAGNERTQSTNIGQTAGDGVTAVGNNFNESSSPYNYSDPENPAP